MISQIFIIHVFSCCFMLGIFFQFFSIIDWVLIEFLNGLLIRFWFCGHILYIKEYYFNLIELEWGKNKENIQKWKHSQTKLKEQKTNFEIFGELIKLSGKSNRYFIGSFLFGFVFKTLERVFSLVRVYVCGVLRAVGNMDFQFNLPDYITTISIGWCPEVFIGWPI